jgi:CRISP-associated protein Cas1
MRKLLNVLYITQEDVYISKDGENIIITKQDEKLGRFPIHNLEGIVCFNYAGVSPRLMEMCVKNNVSLNFMSVNGKFLARVTGKATGNVLLRVKQYKVYENIETSAKIAKNIVLGKLLNSRNILNRFTRDYKQNVTQQFSENLVKLDTTINTLRNYEAIDIDKVRGYEGLGSRIYFENFNDLILSKKDDFYFYGRSKRPPLDNMNCLLSFIYVILASDCHSALETVGLDPQVGFLHRIRTGRNSLALDLIEELRAYIGDRLALTLVNTGVVENKDFYKKENDSVIMTDSCRKKVIESYQKRKKEIITHKFIDEKIEIGLIPYVQAMLMNRYLRGDLDEYPPFIIK